MKARDVMTARVVSVRADTPNREIARLLLENHISAVPVLDGSGAPIGMVSEGDLIGRDDREREARRDWWLAMLAEGEQLSPEFLAGLRHPTRSAGEIMSRPVVTVGEETDTGEIARLLRAHRIKRVPVVRDGQMVGIVSRDNLLRALAEERPHENARPRGRLLAGAFEAIDRHFEHPHHADERHTEPKASLEKSRLNVADFRSLVADHESKELKHRTEQGRLEAEQHRRWTTDLIDRHISDAGWRNLLHQARLAAEHGEQEFMLLRFPNQLCSDGGRAINITEPDWPATLRGEAAELYLRWERDLKQQGFYLAARVLEFPGGLPGDIGLFLVWRR